MLTRSPTIRTNYNNSKTTFSNHKQKKNRTNYSSTLHATMEMPEYLQDKILVRAIRTWNYLRKYKNNHAKNSLPHETCSNASTDARIWESGPATLNPLNLHCYRFALGHHLFKHKLSPYDEKEATLISCCTLLYTHRRPLPHQTPILYSCYPSPYSNSSSGSRNCFQTNLLALLESLIGCYKLETLNFRPCSYYS